MYDVCRPLPFRLPAVEMTRSSRIILLMQRNAPAWQDGDDVVVFLLAPVSQISCILMHSYGFDDDEEYDAGLDFGRFC